MSQHEKSKEDQKLQQLLKLKRQILKQERQIQNLVRAIENKENIVVILDGLETWEEKKQKQVQEKLLQSLSISRKLVHILPQDWCAELEALHQRLIDTKYPRWRIELSIIRGLLEFLWAYIQIQVENIWLPRGQEVKK